MLFHEAIFHLISIHIVKYSELLGETPISEINESLLSELQLPLGHKLKILKKIKELNIKKEIMEEEKQPIYDQNNMLPSREVTQNEYEELPYEVSFQTFINSTNVDNMFYRSLKRIEKLNLTSQKHQAQL